MSFWHCFTTEVYYSFTSVNSSLLAVTSTATPASFITSAASYFYSYLSRVYISSEIYNTSCNFSSSWQSQPCFISYHIGSTLRVGFFYIIGGLVDSTFCCLSSELYSTSCFIITSSTLIITFVMGPIVSIISSATSPSLSPPTLTASHDLPISVTLSTCPNSPVANCYKL